MKALKSILMLASIAFLASCASQSRDPGNLHHHHMTECDGKGCEMKETTCDMDGCDMGSCKMYEGHCAYSMARGDSDVQGKKEFSLKHGGHVYYFSSKDKMEKFQKSIDENVEKANKNWEAFKWQQWR